MDFDKILSDQTKRRAIPALLFQTDTAGPLIERAEQIQDELVYHLQHERCTPETHARLEAKGGKCDGNQTANNR